MDLTSLDTDTQTPPPTQPTNTNTSKILSFTNGTHKHKHLTTTTGPPPSQPPSMVVSYKECLKNHAASIGGHALDGCGEFMPSSSTNPTDPRSLKCAACGCHRNFHRRDPQEHHSNNNNNPTFLTCFYSIPPSATAPPQPPLPLPLPHRAMSQSTSPSLSSSPSHSPSPMSSPSSPPPLSHLPPSSYHTSSAPHMLLALGNAYSAAPSDEHHHRNLNYSSVVVVKTENNPSGKKRNRTKFSQEQKQKMYSFSEKLGWRMQKGDDGLVQEFCNDIGVPRGVFKVWMHNNKNTFRKRTSEVGNALQTEKTNESEDGNDGRGGFDSDINNPYNTNSSNNDIHRNEDSCVNVHVSVNGLSS